MLKNLLDSNAIKNYDILNPKTYFREIAIDNGDNDCKYAYILESNNKNLKQNSITSQMKFK